MIPSIVSMFSSAGAHDAYSNDLTNLQKQQKLSGSDILARNMLAENANRGLAGYETTKEDINNQLPETIGESKDWMNGSNVVDFLSKSKATTDKQLRDLNIQNEAQRNKNQDTYATFLSSLGAKEQQLLANRTALGENIALNNADKSNSFVNGLTNLVGGVGKAGDMDWTKLIALMSKQQGAGGIDMNSINGRRVTIGSDNFSGPPDILIDRLTPMPYQTL